MPLEPAKPGIVVAGNATHADQALPRATPHQAEADLPTQARTDLQPQVRTSHLPQVRTDHLTRKGADHLPAQALDTASPSRAAPVPGASPVPVAPAPNALSGATLSRPVSAVTPLEDVATASPLGIGSDHANDLRTSQTAAPQPGSASHSATETARHISLQIAEAARQALHRPVELSLNPEELGRVRLSLLPGDGTMTVSIIAERGETLDLMRRHIDVLAQDFRQIGYDNIKFSFGGQGNGGAAGSQSHAQTGANGAPSSGETVAQTTPAPSRSRMHQPVDGLDLRL
jgi:flagellar hook-length control protein FliK